VKLLMSIFGKDDPKRQQVSNNIISGVAPGATGIKVRHTPTARGPDLIGNELSCIEGSGIDIGPHDTAALDRFVQDVAPHFHLMTPEQQAESRARSRRCDSSRKVIERGWLRSCAGSQNALPAAGLLM